MKSRNEDDKGRSAETRAGTKTIKQQEQGKGGRERHDRKAEQNPLPDRTQGEAQKIQETTEKLKSNAKKRKTTNRETNKKREGAGREATEPNQQETPEARKKENASTKSKPRRNPKANDDQKAQKSGSQHRTNH